MGESEIQTNLKIAGTHHSVSLLGCLLAGPTCAQGVPTKESVERPGSPPPRVCCRKLIPLAGSQLPPVPMALGL